MILLVYALFCCAAYLVACGAFVHFLWEKSRDWRKVCHWCGSKIDLRPGDNADGDPCLECWVCSGDGPTPEARLKICRTCRHYAIFHRPIGGCMECSKRCKEYIPVDNLDFMVYKYNKKLKGMLSK